MTRPIHIAFIFGTRPEAIKVAPVIAHMSSLVAFRVTTIVTAQHREMLDQVVALFDLPVTHDLNVMTPNQSLPSLTATLCERISAVLLNDKPDCVLVQGDTTSCFVGALAAFYQQIPVAHLEAGLRTNDPRQPFPEEMNRRLVSHLADYHFAPTDGARLNLIRENIPDERIWVVGNSGIDALHTVSRKARPALHSPLENALRQCTGPLLTVTTHRRENLPFMTGIAAAIYELLSVDEKLHVIFPVHLSPAVRSAVLPMLTDADRCHLLDPLPYDQFVVLMNRSDIILTDSGGIQEEAAYLGKPTLVMRRKTERPEAIDSGNCRVVGDDQHAIFDHALSLLQDPRERAQMSQTSQPYGDGRTSQRVADVLRKALEPRRLLHPSPSASDSITPESPTAPIISPHQKGNHA